MAELKPIKFIKRKRMTKKGVVYYCSIVSSNGKNLSPGDPQTRLSAVSNTIGSILHHVQNNSYEVIDETKPKKKK
jgi:hypothetical protein